MRFIPSAYRKRAEKLAIMCLDENKVPTRFKAKAKTNRIKKDSDIEINFQETVQSWVDLMELMMSHEFPRELIHQLIYLQVPEVFEITSVTEHEDWIEYNDYLIYLRDEIGDDMSIGRFSMIFQSWQESFQKKLERSKGLKDDLAQELMDEGEVEIDGIKIKLWRGATTDTVAIQENWNKVKSLGELNENKAKDSPGIVFTGMFQIPRAEVADYADQLGFRVLSKLSKNAKICVIGTENVGPNKIADFIKLRQSGVEVELMEENAFLEMVLNSGILVKG